MITPCYDVLRSVVKKKGYLWFESGRPYDLNIVGIRNLNAVDRFDDTICIAYLDVESRKRIVHFPATTDPGLYYLNNPLSNVGTAILKEGQYRKSHKIGIHKNYTALVQVSPVTVYRDRNRDNRYDLSNPQMGLFGINIHRALENDLTKTVNKFSAGCQVIQSPDDFNYLIALVKRQEQYLGVSTITYTLLLESDIGIGSN